MCIIDSSVSSKHGHARLTWQLPLSKVILLLFVPIARQRDVEEDKYFQEKDNIRQKSSQRYVCHAMPL